MSFRTILLIITFLIVGISAAFLVSNRNHISDPVSTKRLDSSIKTLSYLPLGDSYTIGQSVSESDRWPNQLAATYEVNGKKLSILTNPAMTGYTTQDLIDIELPLVKTLQPDFVTVQIGVNDYVRGVTPSNFANNLVFIVKEIKSQLDNPNRLMLITIPDFAKTPAGKSFGDQTESTKGIEAFNQIIKDIGMQNRIQVADIFTQSQTVSSDPSLVASDGLHPSAKQYTAWTEIISQELTKSKLLNYF